MTPLADESALLVELRGLAAQGRFRQIVGRLADVPPEILDDRAPFALIAAESHGRLGDYASADRWATHALELARKRLERATELRATHYRGAIALQLGQVDEADSLFHEALELARTTSDPMAQARCFNNLGILSNLRGDAGAALASYQLALAAYQQAGSESGMAETYHNIAISWRALGNPSRALEATDHAVRLARRQADDSLLGLMLVGRADAHLALSDLDLAAAELERATQCYERVGFRAGMPEVWRIQAGVARARGDTTGAVALLERAAATARSEGGAGGANTLAEVERDLGAALEAHGDAAGARAARERARRLFTQLGARAAADQLPS